MTTSSLNELQSHWINYKNDMRPETRNDFLRACSKAFDMGEPIGRDSAKEDSHLASGSSRLIGNEGSNPSSPTNPCEITDMGDIFEALDIARNTISRARNDLMKVSAKQPVPVYVEEEYNPEMVEKLLKLKNQSANAEHAKTVSINQPAFDKIAAENPWLTDASIRQWRAVIEAYEAAKTGTIRSKN